MKNQIPQLGKRWWIAPATAMLVSFVALMEVIYWVNHDHEAAVSIAQAALCLIWMFIAYRIAEWSDKRMRARKEYLSKAGEPTE